MFISRNYTPNLFYRIMRPFLSDVQYKFVIILDVWRPSNFGARVLAISYQSLWTSDAYQVDVVCWILVETCLMEEFDLRVAKASCLYVPKETLVVEFVKLSQMWHPNKTVDYRVLHNWKKRSTTINTGKNEPYTVIKLRRENCHCASTWTLSSSLRRECAFKLAILLCPVVYGLIISLTSILWCFWDALSIAPCQPYYYQLALYQASMSSKLGSSSIQ